MPRYADLDQFYRDVVARFHCVPMIGFSENDLVDFQEIIESANTVDMVPASEVADLRTIIRDHQAAEARWEEPQAASMSKDDDSFSLSVDDIIRRFEQTASQEIGEIAKKLARGHRCYDQGMCECCMQPCPYRQQAREIFFEEHRYANLANQMFDIILKQVLDLIPEQMIAETVRFDSPYGILHTLPGVKNMQEAETIKDRYNKLQELRKKYNGSKN